METSLIGKALNFGFNEYGFESRVSKLHYNYSMSYVTNLININKASKTLVFNINFSKHNLIFLKFFKKFSVIHKFLIVRNNNKTFIRIYLYYYKNKPTCSNFTLLSKPSKKFYISHKAMRLLKKRSGSSIFIISTPRGVLSHQDAILKKTGGIVLGFFSI